MSTFANNVRQPDMRTYQTISNVPCQDPGLIGRFTFIGGRLHACIAGVWHPVVEAAA